MSASRPRVVVSSCLLGERVRYDGGHKHLPGLSEHLQDFVDFVPICPEVMMGLGVPREPIYAQRVGDEINLRVHGSDLDLTECARATAERLRQELGAVEGFILKEKSPSCALTARSFRVGDIPTKGLFATYLEKHYPHAHFASEIQLQGPKGLVTFAFKLYLPRMSTQVRERAQELFSPETGILLSLKLPPWEELRELRLLADRVTS